MSLSHKFKPTEVFCDIEKRVVEMKATTHYWFPRLCLVLVVYSTLHHTGCILCEATNEHDGPMLRHAVSLFPLNPGHFIRTIHQCNGSARSWTS